MMQIYKGIGTDHCDHEDLIDFLNYVFGMNGFDSGFYRLLPKLYRPAFRPEDHNFIVTEDGKLRAAVGSYPIALSVAGHELSAAGIGNVAAHPFRRGKGYMKDCMNMAMRDAVEQGLDFAVLGGRRQRYSYFGFEPAGLCAKFTLEDHNLRHAWGYKGEPFGYKAERVSPDDADALSAIDSLTRRQPSHPLRPADKLYDTLNNWESKVCKVLSPDGAFAGYFLATGSVSEIDCVSPDHAGGVIAACFAFMGKPALDFFIPPYSRTMLDALSDLSEGMVLTVTENYCVLNYERVARACLELKSQLVPLCDGELFLDIDGFAGKESLRVSVSGGKPSVEKAEPGKGISLSHRKAMELLFGPFSQERYALPAFAQNWFPLPLFVPEVDND